MAGQRWGVPVPEPDLTGGPVGSQVIEVDSAGHHADDTGHEVARMLSGSWSCLACDAGWQPRVERPSILFVPDDVNLVLPLGYRGEADCVRCRCFGEYCGHIEEGV